MKKKRGMTKKRKTAIIVGILILVTYGVLLNEITESKPIVMLAEVISGIAVIGIAVLMAPIFKTYHKKLTPPYFILKIIEGALMIIAGILFLFLSTSIIQMREAIYTGHAYIFILSALIFYFLLHKSKIVPRFIPVWGVLGLASLLLINVLETTTTLSPSISVLFYLPIVLNEIFLAGWLIFKGFD